MYNINLKCNRRPISNWFSPRFIFIFKNKIIIHIEAINTVGELYSIRNDSPISCPTITFVIPPKKHTENQVIPRFTIILFNNLTFSHTNTLYFLIKAPILYNMQNHRKLKPPHKANISPTGLIDVAYPENTTNITRRLILACFNSNFAHNKFNTGITNHKATYAVKNQYWLNDNSH